MFWVKTSVLVCQCHRVLTRCLDQACQQQRQFLQSLMSPVKSDQSKFKQCKIDNRCRGVPVLSPYGICYGKKQYIFLFSTSVAQSDICQTGDHEVAGFDPHQVRQPSFVEIDHEIFSTIILQLIQEGQLSVSGKKCEEVLVNCLED